MDSIKELLDKTNPKNLETVAISVEGFLETLTDEELETVGSKAKDVLKQRKVDRKKELSSKILELYEEKNKLGKRIYNLKEIAEILSLPIYTVTQVVKHYKGEK